MASLMTVRLNKGDSSNWGFRLQGGKDFGTPLVIQKVNGGSPAERAGLIAGDSVIKINNTDVFNLRHKDAQDVVVRAGYNFDMTIQRGGSTWKPSVVPTGSYPPVSPSINNISPVTKTSLAARSSENIGAIGTGHNLSAKPFSPQLNGAVNGGPKLVNKQYNSPLKLYSEQSIAETLSAQTEVLSTGALGVNFKKNEKNYDATNSAVFRMLQEAEKEPRGPEIEPDSGVVTSPNSGIAGLRHVHAPETRAAPPTPQLPPGQNICADCERLIVGVFVRIKDKNLHVECFKCATCGTSLKNVGYYNINNKLYCDIHAKLAARNNPPAPNLVPVTVPPGGKVPASAISAALASHSLPSPSALSPKANSYAAPYQPQENVVSSTPLPNLNHLAEANSNASNNNLFNNSTPQPFNSFLKSTGSFSAPKPFSSVSAPLSPHNTLPRAAPLSPVAPAPAPSFSPASSAGRSVQNIIWPPAPEEPELPTACPLYFPPPSQIQAALLIKKQQELEAAESECDYYCDRQEDYCYFDEMAQYQQPKMSICSEEVTSITDRKSAVECIETISGSLQTQQLVENIMRNRPQSPPPIDADIQPREPPRKRDPPQIPQPVPVPSCPLNLTEDLCCQRRETCDLKRPTQFTPNTLECQPKSKFVENTVPQQWESSMVQALRIAPDADAFHQIPTKTSTTPLASALAVAPIEPFTPLPPLSLQPVPLPEETEPYFPPEHPTEIEPKEPKPDKPDSEFVSALKIAPDRPFTPAGGPTPGKKRKDSTDKYFQDLPKPQEHLTMRIALTTASDRVYSPLLVESVGIESQMSEQASVKQTSSIDKSMLIKPMKPPVLPASFQQNIRPPQPPGYYPPILKHKEESISSEEQQEQQTDVVKTRTVQKKEVVPGNPEEVQVVQEVERQTPSNFPPMFQGFTCSFQNKTDHSQFSIEINTTPPILTPEKSQTPVVQVKSTDSVPRTIVTSETVSEEKHAKQLSKKQEKKEVRIVENLPIERQAEEVVLRKPLPLASALHKPESLPQYQVNLSESVEADLQLMQKMEAAQLRMEQQKAMQKTERVTEAVAVKKPIITVQPGETTRMVPQMAFQPVADDRPPSSTFSPRPRPITPSMINKPPSTLPYYQANLVAQKYSAATVNLLDPTSPAVSRSPSPCPERRSQSPFPSSAAASTRPKSPAPGPPPNPLKSSTPLPTPRDSRVEQAKQSLTSFIPQYKSRRDQIEQVQGMDFYKRGDEQAEAVQMYTSQVQMQNIPQCGMRKFEVQQKQVEDTQCAQMQVAQMGASCVSTAISEKSHMEHLDQLSKSEARSVERSSDGLTQIQRKKTVTEEYEHMQKEQMIQIEKNVSTVKKYPFHDVNAPSVEVQGIQGMHITNPQRLTSKFHQTQCAITAPTQCPQGQTCKLLPMTIEPLQTPRQPPMQHVAPPGSIQPVKHVSAPGSSQKPNQSVKKPIVPSPNAGTGGGRQSGAVGVAPKRGRGVLNVAAVGGARIPLCGQCHNHIRGPFITALGRIWCPDHFICATPSCRRPLADMGFVEERGQLYCEYCFEQYLAPPCSKCGAKIKGDCLKAIGKNFHPECFNCVHCGKLFGNNPFFLEDANPYCEADWNEMFTTKCYACGFPVEAGDRWVEALNNNYHSQCFNCTMCKKNLEGQSFFAKGGRPFCKNHAR